jgi:hypothetical protein
MANPNPSQSVGKGGKVRPNGPQVLKTPRAGVQQAIKDARSARSHLRNPR